MKVVGYSKSSKLAQCVPPIPLERPELKKKPASHYVKCKVKQIPGDEDSGDVEIQVSMCDSGTPEEFLLWETDMEKVIVGQNIDADAAAKFALARRLLHLR